MRNVVRWLPGLIAVTAGVVSAAWALGPRPIPAADSVDTTTIESARVAAPGRIEGRGETVALGAGIDGVLDVVLVREGQQVAAGQELARIDCRDLEQDVSRSAAAVTALEQRRTRLLRGGRDDARDEAAAQVAAADARASAAGADLERAEQLWRERVIARAELDRFVAAAAVAKADAAAARAHASAVRQAPLPEELGEVEARLAGARSATEGLRRRLARCAIRAPFAGEIVRVLHHSGETVSLARGEAVIMLADTSRFRVRAEVEETDVGRIHLDDRAVVTAVGLGERRLTGRVIQVGRQMGRKTVLSGDPTEKRDRDVLEVLVELDDVPEDVAIGLRVTVLMTGDR